MYFLKYKNKLFSLISDIIKILFEKLFVVEFEVSYLFSANFLQRRYFKKLLALCLFKLNHFIQKEKLSI